MGTARDVDDHAGPCMDDGDRQTDSFSLGHEPTPPPALFQAGSASETPRNWDLQGLHQLIMDVERYYRG